MVYDYVYKFIIIVDKNSGKTSICDRFVKNIFTEKTLPTIGVGLDMKDIIIKDKKIRLQIWNLSGDIRFRAIVRSYYRNINGVIFVFDKSDQNSFDNLNLWLTEYKTYNNNNVKSILVGTKDDKINITNSKKIDEQALKYAKENGIDTYISCSAKSGKNIYELYEKLTHSIYMSEENILTTSSVELIEDIEKMKKC